MHRRRSFFKQAGAAATATLAAASAPRAFAAQAAGKAADKSGARKPPFKISLAEWSLHQALQSKKIDHLDFASIANGFGIDAVEYVNSFFKDRAKDRAYLGEMKRRAVGEGVWSSLIMIDEEGKLGAADEAQRKQAVENHKKWVEAAAFLGCHCIRVNALADGTPDEQAQRVSDGLRRLSEVADPFGISVTVENHGGLSSNGAWLAKVIKSVAHPRCGTLPDFGNFTIRAGEDYDRYQGVQELMPLAKAVSAKSHDFDKKGNEVHTDYLRMMKIVIAAGYHAYVGIEYEGEKLPELEGILATRKLLERVRNQLAVG
jgi:L-ribulose-5-phosphate 3-epimerase